MLRFNDLNFGEALAVLEGIHSNRITISDDHFSKSVQDMLNKLQIRTQSVTETFSPNDLQNLSGNNSRPMDEILEDCFLCLFISNKDKTYCDSFYKAITASFKVFEKFCLIYKDYLNTKSKLQTIEV